METFTSIYLDNKMTLEVGGDFFCITISGPASRIPSTSNSRMNWFNKKPIMKYLNFVYDGLMNKRYPAVIGHLLKAREVLNKTQVISMINPEHRDRLNVLTAMWRGLPKNNFRLNCDKDTRWQILLICGSETNRMDSHNLTKPICDWLQTIGLVDNDKHLDCWPVRGDQYPSIFNNEDLETFKIYMRPIEASSEILESFISNFTRRPTFPLPGYQLKQIGIF